MKHTFTVLLFYTFLPLSLYGQVNTDSLKRIWFNTYLPDSTRINSINTLAWEGFLFTQPDSAFYFAQKHYDFAKKRGLKKEMAVASNTQGTSFYMSGNFAKAIDYFYKSLRLKEELKDYKGIAATLNKMGMIYDEQKDYEKAIGLYTKAIENFQQLPGKSESDYQVLVASYHNLGVLYLNRGNHEKALDYFNKTLALTDKGKFLRERAYTYSNMGHIFLDQQEPVKSKEYYEKAYEIAKTIGDENGIMDALNNFSSLYVTLENYPLAISYATEALSRAQSSHATAQIEDAAESLYLSYKQLGDYKKALNMYERYISARDSIQSEQNKEEVLRQEYKYMYERQAAADSAAFAATQEIQNLKISEQLAQLQAATTQRMLLYSIMTLLLVLIFVGYRGNKRKIEANRTISQQKLEVEQQRDKIAEQHALLEEKSRKIIEFNTRLETLVEQRTGELKNSLHQIRNYQFNLAHNIRAPYVSLVGLLNLIRDERFDSCDNKEVLQKLDETSRRIAVVLQETSRELNTFDAEEQADREENCKGNHV